MQKIKDYISLPLTICFIGLTMLHFNFKESQEKEVKKLYLKIDSLNSEVKNLNSRVTFLEMNK